MVHGTNFDSILDELKIIIRFPFDMIGTKKIKKSCKQLCHITRAEFFREVC